jgi:hypothetical protein
MALTFALAASGLGSGHLHPFTLSVASAAPKAPPPPHDTTPIPPAADAGTDLALAEKYYGDLDYDKANFVAARVLGQKGLTHSELVRSLRILALTDAATGHEDQAKEEFIELLTYAADFQVDPNLGPRVTAPFLEARGFWRAQPEKPGLDVTPTIHPDGPGTVRVVMRDPTHLAKTGNVGFRWGSTVSFSTFPLPPSDGGDGVVFDVPERPPNIARLDYYAQVFDARGNCVFEVGNSASPKSATVETPVVVVAPVAAPPPKKSIFASPIFWTVVAVVAAGAATTAIALTRPKTPTSATLTGAAECGSSDGAGMAPGACH